ncbi:hypothetical protein F5I97DRAFT_1903773 [Phlebopus sp. FC_14]|nr:hypothetical protein F5I97DRAFT_1903773 [Phlebopus sp. FC_14]
MELYKLTVYGQLDAYQMVICTPGKDTFFKPHKEIPRGNKMFGSLVVVLPAQHEDSALVLRHGDTEWSVDLGWELAIPDKPSIGYVAFFSDVEHEVMPVTSGYRVTLTLFSPFHRNLTELINNEEALPNGGYLGFGLRHEYDAQESLSGLADKLKEADHVLAVMCKELGFAVASSS